MVLTTAPVKVKITKDDETSELRRLAFGYDDSFQQASSGGLFDEQRQGYHLSLCKFLLRSLGGLYPDLPVGKFSELAVFTVKDEDGDMVRFDSKEEFVAAMSYKSWEGCLRVEVTALKPSPSPAAADPEPAPGADAIAAAISEEPAAIASSDPTPMSETASVMSFVSSMSGSSSASAASSASSSSASVASEDAPPVARSLAAPVPAPAPPVDTAAAVEAHDDDEEAMMAAAVAASIAEIAGDSSASTDGNTNGNDNNNNNNNNNNDTEQPVGSSSPPAAPAGFGGPGTPARAFLTQVLPGLADVLARSIYAAHRGSDGVPNTSPVSAREGEGDSAAEKGIAAAAAAAAAAVAANSTATSAAAAPEATTATAQPSTEAAQVGAEPAAAGAAPSAPEVPRTVQPPSAPTPPPPAATADDEDTPPVVHHGVQCDACDVCPIIGTRYKCAVRADFDLCEECERAPVGQGSPFPFLKIRTPTQAPAAIVCLLKHDQPGTAQEAAAAAAAAAGAAAGPGDTPGSNNGGRRTFAPGQGWRGRSNPQHGGWGEGRRKGHRWMRDLARRQQQQFERAASGMGPVPPGVEVVRGNGGGVGCNRQPWCGPRMQRRRDDDPAVPAPASGATTGAGAEVVPNKDTLAAAAASAPISQQFPTPPVGVPEKSDADKAAVVADSAAAAAAAVADTAAASVEEPAETATASAPALEKASPSPSPPSSGEYHDMLAASMRSLASSMTASFPASGSGSSAQEGGTTAGKPSRNSGDTGGNKSSAKPMARFVTDVSVADGSPLPPNTRFVKTWCMRNDGPVTFPAGCKIVPVGGDLMAGPEDGVAVEQRGPGEEFHVSVPLTTPPLSGRYIGYWRLRTAEGQKFGHRVWADVLVTGGTADLVDEGTVDGDWDLVNMQRLSKAVEDTGKDDAPAAAAAAVEPTAPENIPASVQTPSYAPGQAWDPESAKTRDTDTGADRGFEESKSSDEAAAGGDDGGFVDAPEQHAAPVAVAPSAPSVPPTMASKWHRELCSLAEMGFESTQRNVQLLEKHVVNSGSPGMERVLHELLSWREVSIQ